MTCGQRAIKPPNPMERHRSRHRGPTLMQTLMMSRQQVLHYTQVLLALQPQQAKPHTSNKLTEIVPTQITNYVCASRAGRHQIWYTLKAVRGFPKR